jgi:hypothetical protein
MHNTFICAFVQRGMLVQVNVSQSSFLAGFFATTLTSNYQVDQVERTREGKEGKGFR